MNAEKFTAIIAPLLLSLVSGCAVIDEHTTTKSHAFRDSKGNDQVGGSLTWPANEKGGGAHPLGNAELECAIDPPGKHRAEVERALRARWLVGPSSLTEGNEANEEPGV